MLAVPALVAVKVDVQVAVPAVPPAARLHVVKPPETPLTAIDIVPVGLLSVPEV